MQYVPMLNDFAVFVEPKYVDACIVITARPYLVAMQDNQITLGD